MVKIIWTGQTNLGTKCGWSAVYCYEANFVKTKAKLVKTAQVWGKTIQHQNLLWLDLARKSQENDLRT